MNFFFLQTTSTKNYSVTHFSVYTFIELPKTKLDKRKRRKKRRVVEKKKKKKDPLMGQSSKRKKLNTLWCCPHSMKAEGTSNIHLISCL
jgi:hypothetical protein